MTDVFISYSSKDRVQVQTIVAELEHRGVKVFWDQHIHAGDSWQETLQRHVAIARAVVVVWSTHAAESEWVRSEAEFAVLHKKYLAINVGDKLAVPIPYDQCKCVQWDAAMTAGEE